MKLRPKFNYQLPTLEKIDHSFYSKIKYREVLLKDKNKNTEEIKRIDIFLAYYIKKRARVTKGGFNFIPKEMWEWQPIFEIDSSLLPKNKR